MTILTNPEHIRLYQFFAQIQALKMETLGMKHSSGRSMYAYLKQKYGYKGNKQKVYDLAMADYDKMKNTLLTPDIGSEANNV